MARKKVKWGNFFVDSVMLLFMVVQMLYVFEGNLFHEILGMTFFVTIIVHIFMKRKVLLAMLRKKVHGWMLVSGIVIILLTADLLLLMITSIAVSRALFPGITWDGSVPLHTLLAAIGLSLAAFHSCLHGIVHAKKKRIPVIISGIVSIAAFAFGYSGVPYMNRHFRTVEITYDSVHKKQIECLDRDRIVTVYFTRVGNTDFKENVDAVSGASLMLREGELVGNTQLLAEMVEEALGCDTKAITLTGEKYPSAYNDTVIVAGKELKNAIHPAIESIDISNYDKVILIYPVWWGTIPMPVATFLEENSWEGKEMWVLGTHGGSKYASSVKDIETITGHSVSVVGPDIYCDDIPNVFDTIYDWLEKNLK